MHSAIFCLAAHFISETPDAAPMLLWAKTDGRLPTDGVTYKYATKNSAVRAVSTHLPFCFAI